MLLAQEFRAEFFAGGLAETSKGQACDSSATRQLLRDAARLVQRLRLSKHDTVDLMKVYRSTARRTGLTDPGCFT